MKEVANMNDDTFMINPSLLTLSPPLSDLSEDQINRIKDIFSKIENLELMSLENFILGFKRDAYPENGIAVWEDMAQRYVLVTKPYGLPLSLAERKFVFAEIFTGINQEHPVQVVSIPRNEEN